MCARTVLRLVAEGKIPWAFWPPGSSVSGDDGIWLKDGVQQDGLDIDEDRDDEEGSEDEMEELSNDEEDIETRIKIAGEPEDEDEDEDDEGEDKFSFEGNLGRFGALRIDD